VSIQSAETRLLHVIFNDIDTRSWVPLLRVSDTVVITELKPTSLTVTLCVRLGVASPSCAATQVGDQSIDTPTFVCGRRSQVTRVRSDACVAHGPYDAALVSYQGVITGVDTHAVRLDHEVHLCLQLWAWPAHSREWWLKCGNRITIHHVHPIYMWGKLRALSACALTQIVPTEVSPDSTRSLRRLACPAPVPADSLRPDS
jgi:hypothetical protein